MSARHPQFLYGTCILRPDCEDLSRPVVAELSDDLVAGEGSADHGCVGPPKSARTVVSRKPPGASILGEGGAGYPVR